MRHRPLFPALAALLLTSCEDPGSFADTGAASAEPAAEQADWQPPDDELAGRIEAAERAAILRADMARELQEYVLLMSLLTGEVIDRHPTYPIRVELDTTISDLSDSVGEAFGSTVGDRFYTLWAPTPALYARYASAVRDGNTTEQTAVKTALTKWLKDTTDLLVAANPYVSRTFLSGVSSTWTTNGRLWFLKEDIMLAIESQRHGSPYEGAQYTRWRATSYKVTAIAEHLIYATERRDPARLAGDGNAPGAEYRVAHAHLFGQLAYTGAWEIRARIGQGYDPNAARGAQSAAKWETGVNLGGITSSSINVPAVYDAAFRDAYWKSMDTYLIYLTAYVKAQLRGDGAAATYARNTLYAWAGTHAALFANKNPYISKTWLQTELRAFVDQMLLVADRQRAGDTRWYALVNDAEDRMARVGAEIAIDIEAHRPTQVATWSTKWHP